MSLTVGQLAKLSGVSVRSLHHYDEIGLLSPSERSEAGYRLYSERDVERLNQIQGLRWLELPLEGVKKLLNDEGATIPRVVDETIDALTAQITSATALRARLENLRNQIASVPITGAKQLIAVVELYKHYERHLTLDELNRFQLMSEADNAEWRKVHDEVVSALERKVSPESDEAQEIAYRWGVLAYKRSNNDMTLAIKAKAAYENDEGVRRAMAALTNTDPAVMQFVLAASHHGHLRILGRYLSLEQVRRLNLATLASSDWLHVASALRERCARPPLEDDETQLLLNEWNRHLDVVTGGDQSLKDTLLDAIRRDDGLKKRWLASDAMLDFVHQARQLTRSNSHSQ